MTKQSRFVRGNHQDEGRQARAPSAPLSPARGPPKHHQPVRTFILSGAAPNFRRSLATEARKPAHETKAVAAGARTSVVAMARATAAASMPTAMPVPVHPLKGEWADHREYHIGSDFLLVYQVQGNLLNFVRAGTHAELFE
jgi:addiction module RelE/StbE family toxin